MSSTNLKSKLFKEFKELEKGKNPEITADIEAVVVLSGESGDPENPTKLKDTEERIQLGIKIFKKVRELGGNPTLILNGTGTQNILMTKIAEKEKVEKILTIKNPSVPAASTLTQFQGLKNLHFAKIALVTHAYHSPRVKRYAAKYLSKDCVFHIFLLDRDKMTQTQITEEIEKIIKYKLET